MLQYTKKSIWLIVIYKLKQKFGAEVIDNILQRRLMYYGMVLDSYILHKHIDIYFSMLDIF